MGKHFPGNQTKFFWLESVFRWPESIFVDWKVFFRWLESVFRLLTFLMANKHRKVWKVVFRKVVFGKPLSKLFYVCVPSEKLVNRKHFSVTGKHFSVKGKFGLIFKKVFSFYFGRKTLFRSCEKFRNIILFADYIKFDPQTFDYYIYCFDFFFNFIP